MSIKLRDLPVLISATTTCRRALRSMTTKQRKQEGLQGLATVLAHITKTIREARRAVKTAKKNGESGRLLLAFVPMEWWALWHALNCQKKIDTVEQAEETLPYELEKLAIRRKSLEALLDLVHAALHHPQMPNRCTCQDKVPTQAKKEDSYKWN